MQDRSNSTTRNSDRTTSNSSSHTRNNNDATTRNNGSTPRNWIGHTRNNLRFSGVATVVSGKTVLRHGFVLVFLGLTQQSKTNLSIKKMPTFIVRVVHDEKRTL